ncbi:MAG: efflux RND transporter periplasmic adaptor subunit [Bacteroidales bacterium]|nr:efflux RND transporter periplasmic adaptor subunit [Bacteroidales bacterium]
MKINVLYIALCLLVVTAGCRNKEAREEIKAVAVDIVVIDSVESGLTRTYVGEVKENSAVSLNFPAGGTVRVVRVHEGDYVREGALLASIDKQNAQSAYDAAKAKLAQAEDGYKRLKQVYEQGSVAEVKWVEIQTALEQARSMEKIAKRQLEECEIHAPFSGVVGKCDAEAGGNILPGQPAIELLNISSVSIVFSVPENEISTVAVGQNAKIEIPALHGFLMTGRISQKSATSNRVSHSYQVSIDVANSSKELIPGMVCKVYLSEPNSNGYVLPAKAVQTRQEGLSVWKVKNGLATRQMIESAEFVANGVLVTNGLEQGDSVIVDGRQKLYDNAKVICTKKIY